MLRAKLGVAGRPGVTGSRRQVRASCWNVRSALNAEADDLTPYAARGATLILSRDAERLPR
jgi:hypothetical protein